jgi:hypothetical protein
MPGDERPEMAGALNTVDQGDVVACVALLVWRAASMRLSRKRKARVRRILIGGRQSKAEWHALWAAHANPVFEAFRRARIAEAQ